MLLTGFSEVCADEADYRLKFVRDQAQSGLSVAEYCRGHDLCVATFYNWRRLERERGAGNPGVSFTEIGRVEGFRTPWAAEVVLRSGAVVRVGIGADVQLLRALFEALG